MKRSLRLLLSALVLIVAGGSAWAETNYSTVLTSNVGLSGTGNGHFGSTAIIQFGLGKNYPQYDAFRSAVTTMSSQTVGAITITVPAGTKKLHFHAVGYAEKAPALRVGVEGNSGTLLSTTLTADAGFTNDSPYILRNTPASSYYSVTLPNVPTADTRVMFFSTNGDNFLLYGVNAETESGEIRVLTVAEALGQSSNTMAYVKGIVVSKEAMSGGTISYYISDDGTNTNKMRVVSCKNIGNTDFTSDSQLRVRDEVVVYGQVFGRTDGIKVLNQSYLISVEHPKFYWKNSTEELTYDESLNAYVITKEFPLTDGNNTNFWIQDDDGNIYCHPSGYGDFTFYNQNLPVVNDGDKANFRISETGTFTIQFNAEDMKLSVTGWPEPTYYLNSDRDASNELLNVSEPLQKGEDGTYSRTVTIPQSFFDADNLMAFSFREGSTYIGGSEAIYISDDNCTDIPLTVGGLKRVIITNAGTYNIIFNPTALTVSVVKQAVLEPGFYIDYSATSEWVREKMEAREDGTYYKHIAVSADGYFFGIYGSENDETFGSTGSITVVGNTNVLVSNKNGSKVYVMPINDPGTYDVVFNPTTRELTVTVADAYYFVYNDDVESKQEFVPEEENKFKLNYLIYLQHGNPFYVLDKDGNKIGFPSSNFEIGTTGSCLMVENGQSLTVAESGFYQIGYLKLESGNANLTVKKTDQHFYALIPNEAEDDADQVTELVYNEEANTYEADIEIGSNGNFYLSCYNTWDEKEKESYIPAYNIVNNLGVALPLLRRPWANYISTPGTYHLSLNPDGMTLTVTEAEQGGQKFYITGGAGGWGPEHMSQLIYNPSTNAYEAEIEFTAEQDFIIITGNKASDWGEWGNLQYYGISEGNAYNKDYVVTTGDTELQIQEIPLGSGAAFKFLVPGTYKISLTPDLKLSVTWPEGVSDKYYFRKGISTEEMFHSGSDGSLSYTVTLTPADVHGASEYPVFEIFSGDGHSYEPQGDDWTITATNCQNLPVEKGTRMKWFKVSEPGEYRFVFNPAEKTLSVEMPTTEYKYYFLKVKSDWTGAAQVGELVYNAETNTYESTENLVVEEDPGYASFYISTKDNWTDMWSEYYSTSEESLDLAVQSTVQLVASANPLGVRSAGSYHLSLDAVNMKLTVTEAQEREKMYFWPASKGNFSDFSTVTEMTYNPETNAYEKEVEFTDSYLVFYLADSQITGWGDMAKHAYGSSEAGNTSSVSLSPVLTSIQLEKYNAGFAIDIPGTYKISIDADTKMMTVSGFKKYYYWPAPGWGIQSGTQTEMVYNTGTGAYEAIVTAEFDEEVNSTIGAISSANPAEHWLAYDYRIGYEGIIDIDSPVQLVSEQWVRLEKSGTYHLSLNPGTMTLTVKDAAEAEKYYIRLRSDETSSWDNKEMEEREDGTFYQRIEVTDESSSIIIDSGIGESFGGATIDGSGTPVELTSRGSLMAISLGTYDVVFAPATRMLTVTKVQESENQYYFWPAPGWIFAEGTQTEMVYNAETKAYEATVTVEADDEYNVAAGAISTTDVSWEVYSNKYGYNGTIGDNFSGQIEKGEVWLMFAEPGTYSLSLDAASMMLTATKVSSVELTDISQMDNVIYMEPQEVRTGAQATLTLKMKNNVPIRGFQFNLYLPEGITAATSSNGKILATLDKTRLPEDDDHQLTTSIHEDGAILFLCSSEYNENFATGDDIVLTLKVNISEDMQVGDYPVVLKTVKLSETDITKYYETELVQSKVTVSSYLPGDVNADGRVDISDYISVANYIHGDRAAGFVFKAGDIDSNGAIDITDYIGISNIIHTGSPTGTSAAGAKAAVFELEEVSELDPE